MKLNSKQELFCREYSLDLNATQAYIRAGYSKKGASVSAYKLLTNTRIHERVQELFDERAERTEITSDRVLTEAWNNYVVLRDRDELKEAHPYLKMVGDHTSVRAFDKTVKVEDARYANFSDAELIARHNALQKKLDEQLGGTEKLLGVIDG
jgi:hypothetical protein